MGHKGTDPLGWPQAPLSPARAETTLSVLLNRELPGLMGNRLGRSSVGPRWLLEVVPRILPTSCPSCRVPDPAGFSTCPCN